MLDARDLATALDVEAVPAGASFVAARVLLQSELDWFAARGISVVLLVERQSFHTSVVWTLNGKLHRDGDLPAIEYANGRREWYFQGMQHRENDLPAIEHANGSREWWVHGKNIATAIGPR